MHDILNTEAATRARQARGPFTTRKIGRRALRLWVKPLAKHLHSRKPPRGFEIILARLTYPQLAAMALCAVLDRIGKGWAEERDKWKFCLDLGRAVRDEFEYAGLYAAKKYVDA